jgi:lipopolysaccharide assembly outer membrane protein LptD (OstA)
VRIVADERPSRPVLPVAGDIEKPDEAHARPAAPPVNIEPNPRPRPVVIPSGVDIRADSLEYKEETGDIIGNGNVVVQRLGDTLRADYVQVNAKTMDAFARGNVVLLRDEWEWTGKELHYNFKTKRGDFGTFDGTSGEFYIRAKESKQLESGVYEMRGVMVTTCDKDDLEFKIRASSATLEDGHLLKAHNMVSYLGPVPFFYLPYMQLDLDKRYSNWDVSLGHTGNWGPFLLVGYRKRLNENVETVTHVDLRAERGLGLGEDIHWRRSDDSGNGRLELYYMNDQDPLNNEYDEWKFGYQVDSDRYRIRFVHNEAITDRDSLTADLQYLSDPKFREDFFEREFRLQAQPENRVSVDHRGDHYSAGILMNVRLNDFYENIDRKPELTLDFYRQELGDSRIYYEGENSFVKMEKLFPDSLNEEDFDLTRFDTYHNLYYPGKYFGFLNLIPSIGARATHYSDLTPLITSTTNSVIITDSNGVARTTNQVSSTSADAGSDMRTFVEIGLETSFKAFKIINNEETVFGHGLRHVVEPYAAYFFRSDPSVKADDIYQMDRIDSIRKRNDITFGARNKLQTRRDKRLVDLIDLDVFTSLRLDPDVEENDMGPLVLDAELQPTDLIWMDMDARYDWDQSALTDFNARLRLGGNGNTRMYVGYGYRHEDKDNENNANDKNLIASDLNYYPTSDWGLGMYIRYNIDNSELEAHRYSVLHKMDCVGWETGVSFIAGRGGEKDDTQFWAKIWLLAFPQMELKVFDASY